MANGARRAIEMHSQGKRRRLREEEEARSVCELQVDLQNFKEMVRAELDAVGARIAVVEERSLRIVNVPCAVVVVDCCLPFVVCCWF